MIEFEELKSEIEEAEFCAIDELVSYSVIDCGDKFGVDTYHQAKQKKLKILETVRSAKRPKKWFKRVTKERGAPLYQLTIHRA